MLPNFTLWKRIIYFLLAILLLNDSAFAQNRPGQVVLMDKRSGRTLSGATITSLNNKFSTTSDSLGRAVIPSVITRKGGMMLISMVGYKQISVGAIKLAVSQRVDMEPDMATLKEVWVTKNNPMDRVRDLQMGSEVITALEARKLPAILGEVDILKIFQLKPGVKNGGEGLSGFYVRGGGAGQNLILIDAVPVYNPNHLLGLFSIFNNDAIRDVRLYKAAYPARYSGRLSSVLDVSTRAGSMDSLMITGGVGLLSSRLSLEAPIEKGKSSFIISGRRTYFDVFTRALNKMNEGKPDYETIPAYFFSDINLRSDWKINSSNVLWATGYLGSDNFGSGFSNLAGKFTWGNRTASLNWKSVLRNKTDITSTVFYSGYQYQLGNRSGFNNLEMRSGINTLGVKVIASNIKTNAFNIQGGIDGMVHKLKIGDFKSSSDLSGYQVGEKASGNEWGVFVNSEWSRSEKLALLGGIRLSGFYTAKHLYINPEPRLSGRFKIGENSSLKASYTRMYQYLHLASLSSASLPIDIWYPSTDRSRPEYADQVSLGWSRAINDNKFFLSLEGYYKWMGNQIEFRDGANLFGNPKLENDFVYGRGNAYGMETYIEKKTGRTTGWLGYTLSWTTKTFADINDGEPFKPRYDRRHDLSLVFMHKLSKTLMFSGNWVFGSGAYITIPVGRYVFQDQAGSQFRSIIPVYTKRSNYQLAPVHRIDLNLVVALKSRHGSKDITISLYNAYSRRNPFYIQFQELSNKQGYITAIEPTLVSLFPLLPGVTYNFKF